MGVGNNTQTAGKNYVNITNRYGDLSDVNALTGPFEPDTIIAIENVTGYDLDPNFVLSAELSDGDFDPAANSYLAYWKQDDQVWVIFDQDEGGQNRGGVYADLAAVNAAVPSPNTNDWVTVIDATGAVGTIDPNADNYTVAWNGADWVIINTDTNDSAWVNTTLGVLGTTVTTDQTSDAGRSGDTQVSEGGRNIFINNGIGSVDRASNLNLINAEPNADRIEVIRMGQSHVQINALNSTGGETTEIFNATQGNAPKSLKNGSCMRIGRNFTSAHSNPNLPLETMSIDINNNAIGDPVTFDNIYQIFANGRIKFSKYGQGNKVGGFNYIGGINGAGDWVEIPKSKWRRFQNLSSINIPSNGLNNFANLRSFNFTVLNNCSIIVFPVFRANQQSPGDQTRLKASITINGGAFIDASIESRQVDQGVSFGWLNGVHDMIIEEVSAGDSIEVYCRGSTDGISVLQAAGFFIIENHTLVQA